MIAIDRWRALLAHGLGEEWTADLVAWKVGALAALEDDATFRRVDRIIEAMATAIRDALRSGLLEPAEAPPAIAASLREPEVFDWRAQPGSDEEAAP